MKVSILTATYNRGNDLERLYTSLVVASNSNVDFEWLIMDDGSNDKTKLIVDGFIKQNIIDVEYHYQPNQGKMSAINNLMYYVSGDIAVTCDSDDYFTVDALDEIKKNADKLLNDDTVYALAFLKQDAKGRISGNKFIEDNHRSDMFSLYFREKTTGEKILVFKTEIRKKYHHELEADEKFVTESRMYHKMDLDYDVIGINKAIEIGDYRKDGYTKNILKVFKESPLGYYEYFREILEMNLKGVTLKKRIYIYKHYILFANLADREHAIRNVEGLINKIIITLLWIPGTIKTRSKFGKDEKEDFVVDKEESKIKNKEDFISEKENIKTDNKENFEVEKDNENRLKGIELEKEEIVSKNIKDDEIKNIEEKIDNEKLIEEDTENELKENNKEAKRIKKIIENMKNKIKSKSKHKKINVK